MKVLATTTAYIKKNRLALAIIAITWLVFFSRTLFAGQLYFLDDLKIIFYPLEAAYASAEHAFTLPTWNTYFGFGQPLIGWGQLGFFNPLHALLRAVYVPPLILLQISILTYFLLGSITAFIFFRLRRFSQTASTLGALVFTYCGFMVGHLNHVNFYTATMVLPSLLIAIHCFIEKPTIRRAGIMAIIAAIIPLSGQPQIALYTLAIAAILGFAMAASKLGSANVSIRNYWLRLTSYTLLSAVIALCLSSFATLPLMEFLPQTERADDLSITELLDFSYPPYNAITLIEPYFFGDHQSYWGPKGFQELAAFTGVIPLILGGVALTSWKKRKTEQIPALILIIIGTGLALAKYSPLYVWLVENHYITTLNIPGRFVFFVTTGIALLSASGLQLLEELTTKQPTRIKWVVPAGLIIAASIFIPFALTAASDMTIHNRLMGLLHVNNPILWLIIAGIISCVLVSIPRIWSRFSKPIPTISMVVLAAITLVAYGWNFNPLSSAASALAPSPFEDTLKAYKQQTGRTPRIYARESLPVTGYDPKQTRVSEPISPTFTVYQPLNPREADLRCLDVPFRVDESRHDTITITLEQGINGPALQTRQITTDDLHNNPTQTICLPDNIAATPTDLALEFSSQTDTGIQLLVNPETITSNQIYFVRKENPTADQIAQSQKPLSLQYDQKFIEKNEIDKALLIRHLNVLANTSSARWIGALSIRPYRQFIETFFANDVDEPIDGDGKHALIRNRALVNMAGITHFTQKLDYGFTTDPMVEVGFKLVQESDTGHEIVRLYENPDAMPPVFLVPTAIYKPADDEIRYGLRDPNYDPNKLIYISGPTPPDTGTIPAPDDLQHVNFATLPTLDSATNHATIATYTQTQADIHTSATQDSWLVFTDATTPQWHTYIDGNEAPWYTANSIFKAARVPAGDHTISFRYNSPAINRASTLSIIGLIAALACTCFPLKRQPE